jgi:hypothetical protein
MAAMVAMAGVIATGVTAVGVIGAGAITDGVITGVTAADSGITVITAAVTTANRRAGEKTVALEIRQVSSGPRQ